MDSSDVIEVQNQIKQNTEDMQKYLLDLECWEKEMKRKEKELKLIQTTPEEDVPPIRNLLYRSKRKNRHKKQKDKCCITKKTPVPTCDYKAWERFDADAELMKVDEEIKQSSPSENEESSDKEDDFTIQKMKQLAILHKDKGNEFFKNNNYDSAINSYTTGMHLDPENPLLPANRAMAFLKKGQFQAAENDCTLCLSIDPTYVKAYLRRGTARKNLNKFSLASADFSKALELEPENKQALTELKNLAGKSGNEINEAPCKTNESEVIKTQQIWPQFLGNKTVQPNSHSNRTEESSISSSNSDCIFPNATSLPIMVASQMDENLQVQIEVTEMEENSFIKTVERTLDEIRNSEATEHSNVEVVENMISEFEPLLPPVPVSSYQFLADWNEIMNKPNLRYKYLKQFPPENFPVLFKHYIEPTIFPSLLETLSTSFLENGDDVFQYLKYLSNVGRFSTMVMFLSKKEEKELDILLESIKKSNWPESEVSAVIKKYKC